jgi:predicted ATP-dependent endonuclease of OLD family
MHIKFVEIANFRKLLSVRIDLDPKTTLFVGANNSGKTSAMVALRKFLSPKRPPFETLDITLCHWAEIDDIGNEWLKRHEEGVSFDPAISKWSCLMPTIDIWIEVEADQVHLIRGLIPTLQWTGGLLGLRLRLDPKDPEALYKDFVSAVTAARAVRKVAEDSCAANGNEPTKLTLWPTNLVDFLNRRLRNHFAIRAFPLDPNKVNRLTGVKASMQELDEYVDPIEGDPLSGLIRVDEIPAQRGLGEAAPSEFDDVHANPSSGSRLSDQLRKYYARHLDPTDQPDPNDLSALQAIEAAQDAFNERLTDSFQPAFSEVEGMGYPGVTDPRPRVSTRLTAIDGLDHTAAVTFEIDALERTGEAPPILRLPEGNNGLGYQNLISMIFRLMSFRDAWVKVGKAAKRQESLTIEPLHLVLVEEPEAHLHAQVQQVFINKAYDVLRARPEIRSSKLCSQLLVSTHSSHVAHEMPFSSLRYFRRLPAGMAARIPVATVVNLSVVFGPDNETVRFVTRYLRAHHADLFFADAAILVEGPAERILLPNFIRSHFPRLCQCYISLLEIGGSHAHRFQSLLEHLGLVTLIITDLDSMDPATGKSTPPALLAKQVTRNPTLKEWLPKVNEIDALWALPPEKKIDARDELCAIRVAFQTPIQVTHACKTGATYPYTFEDALALENLTYFEDRKGSGILRKFREAIAEEKEIPSLSGRFYDALKSGKAEFALDLLGQEDFEKLQPPTYIREGLDWLQASLTKKQAEKLALPESAVEAA